MTDDDKALLKRIRSLLFNPDGKAAADRIEALSAENERLRDALEWYVAEDAKYMRAALGDTE